MKKATLEQWIALFNETEKLVKNKPWEQFEDLELFGIKLPDEKKKFYCSIMGYYKTCLGLAIYTGNEGLDTIAAIASELPLTAQEYLSFDAGWMAVYLDSADQLSDQQEEIRKKAEKDLKHPEVYMVVRPHMFPSDPDEKEVLLLTEIIKALNEAINYYFSLKIDFDFEKYVFVYDVEKKKHRKQHFELKLDKYLPIVLNPEILDDLKSLKRNHETWGMDLVYLNEAIEGPDEDHAVRCKGFFVENQSQGILIEGMPLKPEEELDTVIDVMLELFEENGMPDKIVVRNPHMMSILIGTCKIMNIELEVNDDFEMVDEVLMRIQNQEGIPLN